MCAYCGWAQHVDNPERTPTPPPTHQSWTSLTSWKTPVTGNTEEFYTQWCNISSRPSPPSSFFFSFSPLPNAISLDWMAPGHKPQWPCGVVSSAPPPFPCSADSSGVEVVWLMSSNPISQRSLPLQLVASVMPYRSIRVTPPLCMLITVWQTGNTKYRADPLPRAARTARYGSRVITAVGDSTWRLEFGFTVEQEQSQQFVQQRSFIFDMFWSVSAVTLFLYNFCNNFYLIFATYCTWKYLFHVFLDVCFGNDNVLEL